MGNAGQFNRGVMRTVRMLPLNRKQIRLFSEEYLTGETEAFLEEMAKQDAWTFARRPLDLRQLIAIWEVTGQLGTRQKQHETNIAIKLKEEDSDRPGGNCLPDDKLRLGAERVALAMMLTRTRSVRSPEQPPDDLLPESILGPSSILTDWSLEERKSLLSRGLFDPATFGRVRFHHRSVQEYLAACRLKKLRKQGMPTSAVFRLLFADIYGIPVVFPSMRETAAWLALWDTDVCRELIRREPESLLSLGDPESLDMATRRDVVRAFAAVNENGGWYGIEIPVEQVRRIAHPELDSVIRECWGDGPANTDVLGFLLELVRMGPVERCADLAHTVAMDATALIDHRIDAIRALVSCVKYDILRGLANAMLDSSTCWPARIIHAVAGDLFPTVIDVGELIALMERTPEPPEGEIGGFKYYARNIVAAVEPQSEVAVSLRDGLADLVWRGRDVSQKPYRVYGRFDHLAPALAKLCELEWAKSSGAPSAKLIRACVIACRFAANVTDVEDSITALRAHFSSDSERRQKAYWAELAFYDEAETCADDWRRFHHAMTNSLVDFLTQADRTWLLEALADAEHPERRAVALHALLQLRHQGNEAGSELDDIRDRLNGEASLTAILANHLAPPTPEQKAANAEHEAWRRQREDEEAREEAQRRQREESLRRDLQAGADTAFSPDNLKGTMERLYRWFLDRAESHGPLDSWDRDALAEAFGAETAGRAEDALRMFWRAFTPTLWSTKSAGERNLVYWHAILGLLAVKVEASTPGWTVTLTSDDARSAVAHATTELNGLPPFVSHLAETHPTETEEVIGGEVSAELCIGGDRAHLPTLQALTHSDRHLKQLCVPRLLQELRFWPRTYTSENGPYWAGHLDRVLRVLSEARNPDDRKSILEVCVDHYCSEPTGPLAFTWLRGMFRFDAIRGTDILVEQFWEGEGLDISEYAVGAFAALLDHDESLVFETEDTQQQARALGKLVRLAHEYVRVEDDIVHKGVFSPGTRDHAETARRRLGEMLFSTPGPEPHRELLELANEEQFASLADRLRQRVRERAATNAEFAPYSPSNIVTLEERYEAPPSDSNGLFTVMMDRLDDLAHDLAHGDFSNRRTLQSIMEESEMQRTVAGRLKDMANGAYSVTREEEVADGKHTDIRLLSVNGNQKAVIEVKIADRRWSLNELKNALREQLVGRYLRDASCKVGCLLLTCHDKNKFWIHPETRKRIYFWDIVEYLNRKARNIEERDPRELRVSVYGLNLSGPTKIGRVDKCLPK